MATFTRQYAERESGHALYDSATGEYTSVRTFTVELEKDDAIVATLEGDAAETFTITHTDRDGVESAVTMRAVARDARRLKEGLSEVLITYEGHVLGVIKEATKFDGGADSAQIYRDWDGQTIGADSEGVSRSVPTMQMTIIENIENADALQVVFPLWNELAGSVNESGWVDPIMGITYAEGEWLYLFPKIAGNRDGTFTVSHAFELDIKYYAGYNLDGKPRRYDATLPTGQQWVESYHLLEYFGYSETAAAQDTGATKPTRSFEDKPTTRRVYPIAGKDQASPKTFAQLFE